MTIDRRGAIVRMLAISGGMVIGADVFLAGCRRADKTAWTAFTPADLAMMDEIGETIIPATDTPGAKAAGIGAFMATTVNDCYDDRVHAVFSRGLVQLDDRCRDRYKRSFVQATPAERTALLTELDREQRTYNKQRKAGEPAHYFTLMKELTLLGYFSSEIGCTKALRYVETPGKYDGNVPYTRGDKAWYNPLKRFG